MLAKSGGFMEKVTVRMMLGVKDTRRSCLKKNSVIEKRFRRETSAHLARAASPNCFSCSLELFTLRS